MTGHDVPRGRVALITGGTDGIGKATARRLLSDGWRVVITGRSATRCEATLAELRSVAAADAVSAIVAHLGVMAEVRKAADAFRATGPRLDLLLLNANAISQARVLTSDGFESNLALGYLGRVLLTRELEDLLRSTAGAQVLTVVGLNLDRLDFDDPSMARGYSAMKALGRWQWAMQVFAREYNRRSPVPMNTFMPGLVKTKILANEPQPMRALVQLVSLVMGLPVERSADEVAWVVDEVQRNHRRGGYFARKKLTPERNLKALPGDAQRLWALTEQWLAPPRAGAAPAT